MRFLMNMVLIGVGLMVMYQQRFRIMRYVISVGILRRLMVRIGMNLPGLREKLFQTTFSRSAL
ncbi:hypothetical protein HNQ94_002749 [Salirhabdus euzebyi]|uniref:Uncharacterized protein n=1 Tax=Salirhabdus euzebyi TaxID=394506 RepID=A0A841Q7G6_9BACI|nr:hypothetical protein [Salirhabdus euzebyi]MBB6454274.1 hypothetical protein [Salirhabdus euzebyi]